MLGSSMQSAQVPTIISDDVAIQLGNGGTVKIQYETADANANYLAVIFPEGGSVDVPAFVIGDASIDNVDTAVLNGLTEPSYVVFNDAGDAYVRIDAGDDAVAGSKGAYFKSAADEDIELMNLSVTGTPRIFWDESEDAFSFYNITIGANSLKTTNLLFKQVDANTMGLYATDGATLKVLLADTFAFNSVISSQDASTAIQTCWNVNDVLILQARDVDGTAWADVITLTSANTPLLSFWGATGSGKIVDARIDDACNSGDATTDGVIDAIRHAIVAYGLVAAA